MFVQFVSSIFNNVYNLFDSVTVPGFTFSFLDLYIGLFVISLAFILLKVLLGIGDGSGVKAKSPRSNRQPKIAENRKGDTK